MHKKKYNNNVTQNFIQGLRPFSTTLPQQIKKNIKKMDLIYLHLLIIGQK